MVVEIVFRNRNGIYDNPQPPIQDGAPIILVQRGVALVGQWCAEVGGFIHPSNQRELEKEALRAILTAYPEVDLTANEIQTFTCPDSISGRFNWNWD